MIGQEQPLVLSSSVVDAGCIVLLVVLFYQLYAQLFDPLYNVSLGLDVFFFLFPFFFFPIRIYF